MSVIIIIIIIIIIIKSLQLRFTVVAYSRRFIIMLINL